MGSISGKFDIRDATTKPDQFATSTKFSEDFSDAVNPLRIFEINSFWYQKVLKAWDQA